MHSRAWLDNRAYNLSTLELGCSLYVGLGSGREGNDRKEQLANPLFLGFTFLQASQVFSRALN